MKKKEPMRRVIRFQITVDVGEFGRVLTAAYAQAKMLAISKTLGLDIGSPEQLMGAINSLATAAEVARKEAGLTEEDVRAVAKSTMGVKDA